jgi:hypothetical protein
MLASVLLAFPLRSFLAFLRLRLAFLLRFAFLFLLALRMLVIPFLTEAKRASDQRRRCGEAASSGWNN